ncbi:MAG TPA: 4Fe-4S dicluster domain-containing protein, partial [Candidatus Bipolaricaulota bacterium]
QAVAAYEAVLEGKPLVERAVSLAGSAVQGPANVRVRIGTPLSELIKLKSPGTAVLGGVMHGAAVSDLQTASVLRDTKAVVALAHPQKVLNMITELGLRKDSHTKVFLTMPGLEKVADVGLHGLERACVRCGYCLDVCPQNLAPILIADFVRGDKLQDAKDLHMNACIECGLCTYVCPSKIPVMSHIQEGKRKALE